MGARGLLRGRTTLVCFPISKSHTLCLLRINDLTYDLALFVGYFLPYRIYPCPFEAHASCLAGDPRACIIASRYHSQHLPWLVMASMASN
jgi:hypothetical protein